jgi:hypothetical protein
MVILDGSPEAAEIDDWLEKAEFRAKKQLAEAEENLYRANYDRDECKRRLLEVQRHRATLRRIKVTP